MSSTDVWGQKQQQQQQQPDSSAAWRNHGVSSGMDDNRDYRFSGSDRKTAPQYQMDTSMRANQYSIGANATIMQTTATRFSNNNQRW